MKTTKLILFILTLFCNFDNSFGQTYYSFPDSNAFWSSEGQNCFNPYWQMHIRYGLIGDTLINGKIYSKVYQLYDSTLTHPLSSYYAAVREENKRIYTIINSNPEQVLYDFNLSIGDTIAYNSFTSGYFTRVVSNIDSIQLLNGQYRKRFSFAYGINCAHPDTVVEGIGSIYWTGLFNPLTDAILTNGDGFTFSCFKQNDTVLYLDNPFCNNCFCSLYVGINDNKKQDDLISISPNPVTDCSILNFTFIENNSYSLTLYNSLGDIQRIYSEIKNGNINICKGELKAGIYLYELKVNDRILYKNKVAIK